MVRPDDIERHAASLISSVDASPFAVGLPSPRFVESSQVLRVSTEGANAHLRFNVYFSDIPATDGGGRVFDDVAECAGNLVVEFLYQLRATRQAADQRDAWTAARHICTALLEDWSDPDADVPYAGVSTRLRNAGRPLISPDVRWLLMRLDFVIDFDLELSRS